MATVEPNRPTTFTTCSSSHGLHRDWIGHPSNTKPVLPETSREGSKKTSKTCTIAYFDYTSLCFFSVLLTGVNKGTTLNAFSKMRQEECSDCKPSWLTVTPAPIRKFGYLAVSPFALFLRELRKRRSLKQKQVADLLGYEQSYISALERSRKGPPKRDFLTRLVRNLQLTEDERQELEDVLRLSKRHVSLPCGASIHEYELLRALEPQLGHLSSKQIALIQIALSPPMTTKITDKTLAQSSKCGGECLEETMT